MEKSTNSVAFAMYLAVYLLFAVLFILWIGTIICRCYRNRFRPFSARTRVVVPTIVVFQTGPANNQEPPRGLEASVIESFPKFAYARNTSGTDTDTSTNKDTDTKLKMKMVGECVVCLGSFEENEMLRLVPKCGHVFHAECVDTWLRSNATCPFCRANLLPDDHDHDHHDETTPVRLQVLIDVNGRT